MNLNIWTQRNIPFNENGWDIWEDIDRTRRFAYTLMAISILGLAVCYFTGQLDLTLLLPSLIPLPRQ